jgi:hypothetical protein
MRQIRNFRTPALSITAALLLLSSQSCAPPESSTALSFEVTAAADVADTPLDGRIVLILAASETPEPRFQVSSGMGAAQIFGIDVNGLAPGAAAVIDGAVFGFPNPDLAHVPAGEYWVQAVLHKYETFNLSTGHTVKLPMDQGEGQHWNRSPGNLYSTPVLLRSSRPRIASG